MTSGDLIGAQRTTRQAREGENERMVDDCVKWIAQKLDVGRAVRQAGQAFYFLRPRNRATGSSGRREWGRRAAAAIWRVRRMGPVLGRGPGGRS